jgi:hypothetical protein
MQAAGRIPYDLRSALRARRGLLGEKEMGDSGLSSSATHSLSGAWCRLESGERRGEGAKALKVLPWTYYGIWLSFLTSERAEWRSMKRFKKVIIAFAMFASTAVFADTPAPLDVRALQAAERRWAQASLEHYRFAFQFQQTPCD